MTHAHMGHYAGLLHLGREAYGTASTLLYGSPRMCSFLASNGPWDLLISAEHLELRPLAAGQSVQLTEDLSVSAMSVPHRDEYSDTLAFRIDGPERSALYLPDIDKWSRWEVPLAQALTDVDAAYLDATFFDAGELPGRAMSEVPHPFVVETMRLLSDEPLRTRNKVHLIHLNHSNPLADPDSSAAARVRAAGMHVAREGDIFEL
ncbi:MAG: pyrroloquinoline quinone biosynthesis protein B [Planctomycetota bacterium]